MKNFTITIMEKRLYRVDCVVEAETKEEAEAKAGAEPSTYETCCELVEVLEATVVKRPVMKSITKLFSTIKEAERFQQWLYGQYDSVKLVKSPFIGESGVYVWQVSTSGKK